MAKIQNLTGHYTIIGLERVRELASELESALNSVTVNVEWTDEGKENG